MRLRQVVDRREAKIPALVERWLLRVFPERVHRRPNEKLDVDTHGRPSVARVIAAAECSRKRAWRTRTIGWPTRASIACGQEVARIRYTTSAVRGSMNTSNSSSPASAWLVSVP